MKESGGWRGKILRVNLTRGELWEEELSEDLKDGYIGGAGINARLLYDALRDKIEIDPLSPENPLIFGFGILVGTSFPCTSRFTVTAKSPVTNIFGDSNAGGFFPVRVKQAGYDHIIIEGMSETPVALFIEKGSPGENGYIESFNGKLRDELLNREIFTTLVEARILIEGWRKEYNQERPHSALHYRPPAPEAITLMGLT